MEDLFNSIYYYTNGFYSVELDSYLYETIPGYLHIGAFMLICSFVVCAIFYYVLAPVRKQKVVGLLQSYKYIVPYFPTIVLKVGLEIWIKQNQK